MKDLYSIILADDHVMFRKGIKSLLERNPGFRVVEEVGDGIDLLESVKKNRPDMVILDISMPGMRGVEALHEIKKIAPDVKVLVLTMHKSTQYLYHMLSAGARGYLLKEDSDSELFSAIKAIRDGKVYITDLLADEVIEEVFHSSEGEKSRPIDPLTLREREVLKLVAEGKSNKDIAGLLNISKRTVENHRARIMKKLGMKNIAELVRYAIQEGYIVDLPVK